ncbi:MAG TPA: nucleoside deaminase, partial [Gemmatimonadales bacterium]
MPLSLGLAIALPSWAASVVGTGRIPIADEARMRLAIRLAQENVERERDGGGGPFGAAVFRDDTGELIGIGVNSVVRLGSSVLHAEPMALMLAERAVGFHAFNVPGAPPSTLVTSCDPCAMCLGAALWSGVHRVVCGAMKEDAEAIGFDEGPVSEDSW